VDGIVELSPQVLHVKCMDGIPGPILRSCLICVKLSNGV